MTLSLPARPPLLLHLLLLPQLLLLPTPGAPAPAPIAPAPVVQGDFELRDKLKKTRLCDKFMTIGTCPYGGKCTFAHGFEELRQAQELKAMSMGGLEGGQMVGGGPGMVVMMPQGPQGRTEQFRSVGQGRAGRGRR